jgi:hypothetical protein
VPLGPCTFAVIVAWSAVVPLPAVDPSVIEKGTVGSMCGVGVGAVGAS